MGQTYLILGASSDLGCAFIQRHKWAVDDTVFAQYCHSAAKLNELADKLPCTLEPIAADFLLEDSTKAFCTYLAEKKIIPTHILHIPAVPIENKRFIEYSWQEALDQLNVQGRSLFCVLQQVIKSMVKRKEGKICIVLSSCCLNVPPKFLSVYVMMKYALMGMAKALAAEYASKNIQINMVSPSMMETKFIKNIYKQVIQQSAQTNPMQRNACPGDVAAIVECLFSTDTVFVTGVNIPVTGGEEF
jgi:3-oxoacyl-[acyl-carrier protein] reductase